MTEFLERVEKELDYQGMKKSELARRLGLPDSTVRSWFVKGAMPAADTALKLAKALNVSLEYLVTGVAERKEEPKPMFTCTEEEQMIVLSFRRLDERDKEDIKDLLKLKCARYASVRNYKLGG